MSRWRNRRPEECPGNDHGMPTSGMELGVVLAHRWHPDADTPDPPDNSVDVYAAVVVSHSIASVGLDRWLDLRRTPQLNAYDRNRREEERREWAEVFLFLTDCAERYA